MGVLIPLSSSQKYDGRIMNDDRIAGRAPIPGTQGGVSTCSPSPRGLGPIISKIGPHPSILVRVEERWF